MNLEQASSRLSGQTVQMNSGGGHGMPQQQHPPVASGNPVVDHFTLKRKAMRQKIMSVIARKKNLTSVTPHLLHSATRLEEVIYKTYPTMADYLAMVKGPVDVHLHHAIQTIAAEGRRRQQLLGQVASGCANGNSVASHLMDTRFTGGNSTTGSMYSGHQNPSTNIPLNSTTGVISVGTTSEGMQRLNHMIPTPGLSNRLCMVILSPLAELGA